MERRDFLRTGVLGGAVMGTGLFSPKVEAETLPAQFARESTNAVALAEDEEFWRARRREFAPAPDFINLEYGYFCPAPLPVLAVEQRGSSEINSRASYFMRRDSRKELETTRSELAELAGVSNEEICITRNTTESMNIIIQGLDLVEGDEIVYSDQDYGSMVEALRQKQERFGIVLKKVAVPLHPESDEEVVAVFEQAITPKTRALHVTHMINLTGHVLPVRKISDMAHAHGVEVIVDSAHAFAHIDYKVADLGCDYLGTSLHKWLCSPVGLGMLYVKKDKIPQLWGLMGDTARDDGDIRKLERLGTRPFNHHRGLREAIRYHEAIGAPGKQARLRYLNRYWTKHFRDHERVVLKTPEDPERHGALANVGIRGVNAKAFGEFLFDRYSILTAPIPNHPVASGVRITPGLPTPLRHLDRLIEAIDQAAKVL